MGFFPQILLGALIVAAFAATMQQRLAIAGHANFLQARQIAYLMRTHHQAAIDLKLARPALETLTDASVAPMINDFRFLSCITGKLVITSMWSITGTPVIPRLMIGTDQANAIAQELARQSVLAPELGRVGQTAWSVGYNGVRSALITPVAGVGIVDGINIQTGTGQIPLPLACLEIPSGAPAIVTQVLP